MAVESRSGGPGHNSGWYNHLIERKTQSVVGSLRQVQAALTVLDGMSKGVARVLNASRLKSIRACNVRVLSLSVEIVDIEAKHPICWKWIQEDQYTCRDCMETSIYEDHPR